MKRTPQDHLLGGILADENVERLRATSLAGMLAATRQRRRRRAIVSGAAASLAIVMVAVVLLPRETHSPASVREASPAPPANRVKIITNEQLLALFPERPVALIGAPGTQRLMFLDAEPDGSTATKKP